MFAPQARDLLLVARSERPVVSLSLGLDRRDPLIRRLLRLGEPGSMGLPQVVLTPLGESLYPPQILFATFLGPAASRFELLAQRLYLPLLLPYDVLEFQLPLRSRAPQGLYGRRLTLVGSAPLLGQPPFEIFPVPRLECFSFAPELFFDGVEASLGGGRIHIGVSLLFEPVAYLSDLLYVLVAHAELLVRVLLIEGGDLRPEDFDLTFGLDAGTLILLQRAGPGGDLLLRGFQRRGRLVQVAPEVGHLLLQVLDQGAGCLHALSERGRLIPGILAHDRFSCVTRNSTMVERVTPGKLGVKTLLSVGRKVVLDHFASISARSGFRLRLSARRLCRLVSMSARALVCAS